MSTGYPGVSEAVWRLDPYASAKSGPDHILRNRRIVGGPSGREIIRLITDRSIGQLRAGRVTISWEGHSREPAHRLVVRIPLGDDLFDFLFNGRHGLRAQFFQAPEQGLSFTVDIVRELMPVAMSAGNQLAWLLPTMSMDEQTADPVTVSEEVAIASIRGRETRVWLPFGSFEEPADESLAIEKWRAVGSKGVKVPMPTKRYIDFKGTFIWDGALDDMESKPHAIWASEVHGTGNS